MRRINTAYKVTITAMTPAIDLLNKHKVAFRTLQYVHDSACENYGLEAVDKLGLVAEQVFKTLVVALDNDNLVVAIVPVVAQLNLKGLAKAAKAKKAVMADKNRVMRTTGYILGGVSPFGQKKRLTTFIDASAMAHDEIFVSAGKRGLEIALAPSVFIELLGATSAAIAK